MSQLPEETNLKKRLDRFTNLIIKTADRYVGKTKPRRNTRPCLTPAVKEAISKRNELRKNVNQHREEWLEACGKAQEAINTAKEESWKDLLATATNEKEGKIWSVIKSLKGSPETNSPNEVMIHQGRAITSNQRKADIFMSHYAAVSKHSFSKEERNVNRQMKKAMRTYNTQSEYGQALTMTELKKALSKMKRGGAQGPDDIPPPFLQELGPLALQELLNIFNASWTTSECPQIWKDAVIIPLLKSGKPASDLASFRPISLTSCISKLMERMVADRLYHYAESKGLFNHQQAGFRKGRGCEDQIARVIQAIQDGFNSKPMKRSILVLLDFSKAYDTVWRERLLLTMLEDEGPSEILRWLRNFLENRQARVQFNEEKSRSRFMKQGLPQGSVLSPILFLFYINRLANSLPTKNINALFADDVSVLSTNNDLEKATKDAQEAVDTVVEWVEVASER